ncbi:MAG TPA: rhodanese-related sulfurtransferase [Saprospiraceae bacterium]|nr:rhodanese-related sulfurtransferase [Saprospiraceae bacterium]
MKRLFNKVNGRLLKEQLQFDKEPRTTLSFYQYARIGNPLVFRDHFFILMDQLDVKGRIYVASEGINAQMSVPEKHIEAFKNALESIVFLKNVRLNYAIEDDGRSFFKLSVKVRNKIVADGLNDETFDVTQKGIHLNAIDFNHLTDDPNTIVVDMRNHYESEVGHFINAITPDVETFRESLPVVEELLQPHKDKNLIMYCTGGIRCEKASAYLKHKGFKKVYQLEGGIIEYARKVSELGIENKFVGKNFVFDERLGERISEEVIAHCHQCGILCDVHVNCANDACHLLFIQCDQCAVKYKKSCSHMCRDFNDLPEEQKRILRKNQVFNGTRFGKGRYKAHRNENSPLL